MSRTLRVASGAAVAALLFAATGVSSAMAQNKTALDPARDTNAPNDVIQVAVKDKGSRIDAVATYRDLRAGHLGVSLNVNPGPSGGPEYALMRFQDFDGRWKVTLWQVRSDRLVRMVRCPGKRVTADYRADTITFRLPHKCTDRGTNPRRDHVQVVGGVQEGGGVRREYAPNKPLTLRRG
jgi:hypothetical protein